jgi:hypothetical protein
MLCVLCFPGAQELAAILSDAAQHEADAVEAATALAVQAALRGPAAQALAYAAAQAAMAAERTRWVDQLQRAGLHPPEVLPLLVAVQVAAAAAAPAPSAAPSAVASSAAAAAAARGRAATPACGGGGGGGGRRAVAAAPAAAGAAAVAAASPRAPAAGGGGSGAGTWAALVGGSSGAADAAGPGSLSVGRPMAIPRRPAEQQQHPHLHPAAHQGSPLASGSPLELGLDLRSEYCGGRSAFMRHAALSAPDAAPQPAPAPPGGDADAAAPPAAAARGSGGAGTAGATAAALSQQLAAEQTRMVAEAAGLSASALAGTKLAVLAPIGSQRASMDGGGGGGLRPAPRAVD